jgi:hypothetical protein
MSKRKKKISRKEQKKQKRITKVYFAIAALLLIALVILLLSNFGVFEKKSGAEYFSIDDECFPIFGSIVHNLKNAGDCKIKCENNCEFRDMEFLNSSFAAENSSCHTCDCYCR